MLSRDFAIPYSIGRDTIREQRFSPSPPVESLNSGLSVARFRWNIDDETMGRRVSFLFFAGLLPAISSVPSFMLE